MFAHRPPPRAPPTIHSMRGYLFYSLVYLKYLEKCLHVADAQSVCFEQMTGSHILSEFAFVFL